MESGLPWDKAEEGQDGGSTSAQAHRVCCPALEGPWSDCACREEIKMKRDEKTVVVSADGRLQFVYHDDLRNLLELGDGSIKRASHVEPTVDSRWQADLSPLGGPLLAPTQTREESLRAEVAWIERHYLGATC